MLKAGAFPDLKRFRMDLSVARRVLDVSLTRSFISTSPTPFLMTSQQDEVAVDADADYANGGRNDQPPPPYQDEQTSAQDQAHDSDVEMLDSAADDVTQSSGDDSSHQLQDIYDILPCPVPCFDPPSHKPFEHDSVQTWAGDLIQWAAAHCPECATAPSAHGPALTNYILLQVSAMAYKILPNTLAPKSLHSAAVALPGFWQLLESHAVRGWKSAKRNGIQPVTKAELDALLQQAHQDHREGVEDGTFSELGDDVHSDLQTPPPPKKSIAPSVKPSAAAAKKTVAAAKKPSASSSKPSAAASTSHLRRSSRIKPSAPSSDERGQDSSQGAAKGMRTRVTK
ncbi:hypothetical protein AURDEDRAFT_178625 [Auricularia subglabra TFB-10046 SS5]|uniref:Uncharacterized protein n=1 Tax=Auricularia subglabra (strain TFB-10046 / SS5) TaxID=717982 RepID=J0L7L8_AURST|nr:hypothetical protein AURDEDRAFT_178625 [Auricularia subglabra TFB-10046 SS5]